MALVIVGIIVAILIVMIIEKAENYLNPVPRMNNADKRFIFIDKVKTRKMYEAIKR